ARERASTSRRPAALRLRPRCWARTSHVCSSFLSLLCPWCLPHPFEMAFERIDVARPEAPEGNEPVIDLHQRLVPDPVGAPLAFAARLHEARLAQYAEVLGHQGLRHSQPALDFADGSLRRREEAENGPAIRLREYGER